MSLKKSLMQQGMKLMSNPNVLKLMQDERFMKVVMTAMSVPGRVQTFTESQREAVVRALGAASEQEVKDLRRTIRALENELAEMKHNSSFRDEE